MKINDDGLSYIDDFQDVAPGFNKKINADLLPLSYATYVLKAPADASIQDNQVDPGPVCFFGKDLVFDGRGPDYEVLTNILRFRFYMLSRFGVILNLHECCFWSSGWTSF